VEAAAGPDFAAPAVEDRIDSVEARAACPVRDRGTVDRSAARRREREGDVRTVRIQLLNVPGDPEMAAAFGTMNPAGQDIRGSPLSHNPDPAPSPMLRIRVMSAADSAGRRHCTSNCVNASTSSSCSPPGNAANCSMKSSTQARAGRSVTASMEQREGFVRDHQLALYRPPLNRSIEPDTARDTDLIADGRMT
jgi:hypothetical protein